ncbi:hypothetical protein EIP86_009586 [Pleurotus ostreatoroseus]|nr:hypothetical protein EIP86_009586 [Pleurotus ostreatoroseus]
MPVPTRTVDPIITRIIEKYDPGSTLSYANSSHSQVRSSSGKDYFVKTGTPSEKDQFIGEAECLKAIHTAAPGLAPHLLECRVVEPGAGVPERSAGKLVFVSEYKDIGSLTDSAAQKLARRLAGEVHAYKSTNGFGFTVPTFCGPTRQDNGWYSTWEECYGALVEGLLSKLPSKYTELKSKGNESGNVGTDKKTGEPVIFDPSSYFGHNEAE